jgi:hypothetical protein
LTFFMNSWDRTSIIFRVGVRSTAWLLTEARRLTFPQDPCVPHRVLAHASGFVGQVDWCAMAALCLSFADILTRSPAGALLLTKLNRAIKIWTEVSQTGKNSTALKYCVICRMEYAERQSSDITTSSPLRGYLEGKVCFQLSLQGYGANSSSLQHSCPLRAVKW